MNTYYCSMNTFVYFYKNILTIVSMINKQHTLNFNPPSLPLVLIWEDTGRFGTKWHEMVVFGKFWQCNTIPVTRTMYQLRTSKRCSFVLVLIHKYESLRNS